MFSEKINNLRRSLYLFNKNYANKSDCDIFIEWINKFFYEECNKKPYFSFRKSNSIKRKNQKLYDFQDCWLKDFFSVEEAYFKNLYFDDTFIKDIKIFEIIFYQLTDTIIKIINKDISLDNEEMLVYEIRVPRLFGLFKVEIKTNKETNSKYFLYFGIYYRKFPNYKLNEVYRIIHFIGIDEEMKKSNQIFPLEIQKSIQELLRQMYNTQIGKINSYKILLR